MKANELMIGDWVYNKNIAQPIQVYPMMFSQMFRQRPDANTEDYNIFPIPLTPEILEKNGWKETWGWWSSGDCFFFMVKYADNSWAKGKYGVSFSEDMEADMFFIGSVHELQHAYRLFGIEKEIVL